MERATILQAMVGLMWIRGIVAAMGDTRLLVQGAVSLLLLLLLFVLPVQLDDSFKLVPAVGLSLALLPHA